MKEFLGKKEELFIINAMQPYFQYDAPSQWYRLKLPQNWEIEEGQENCTSFFDEMNGVGVLQISVYTFPLDEIVKPEKELSEYLAERGYSPPLPTIHSVVLNNDRKIAVAICFDNDTFWKYWAIVERVKFFFITYNCPVSVRSEEEKIADGIVSSLVVF